MQNSIYAMNLADVVAEKGIEKVVAYALRHKISMQHVKEIAAGTRASCRDNPCHVISLPRGMTLAYSIEEHPGGWYNKAYISINGGIPNYELAMAMAVHVTRPHGPKALKKGDSLVYMEPDGTGVNVLIPFVEPSRIKIITIQE